MDRIGGYPARWGRWPPSWNPPPDKDSAANDANDAKGRVTDLSFDAPLGVIRVIGGRVFSLTVYTPRTDTTRANIRSCKCRCDARHSIRTGGHIGRPTRFFETPA